jgi:pyridoxamine 5'-phosphate oxidase
MKILSLFRSILTLGQGVVGGLSEENAGSDPIALFGRWFKEAERAGIFLSEAITLATATKDGKPSARMMLLKGFDERGFTFFTNYESRKAGQIEENPRAAIICHWPTLQRQIRIEGTVTRLPEDESYAYFRTRPRGSQIGAWASKQSHTLESRQELEEKVKKCEEEFADKDVPLPPFWGGYRMAPERMEFWQGRADRLHDRFRFLREGDGWIRDRMSP